MLDNMEGVMVALILVGLLCGIGVGMNFKVLALVPAHVAALALALVMVAIVPASLAHVCLDVICWSLALQAGYVVAVSLQRFTDFDLRVQPGSRPGKGAPRGH